MTTWRHAVVRFVARTLDVDVAFDVPTTVYDRLDAVEAVVVESMVEIGDVKNTLDAIMFAIAEQHGADAAGDENVFQASGTFVGMLN